MPDAPIPAETVLSEMSWLRRLARRLVRDADTADDVVQDTWVAAVERRPADLEGPRLRAWLATVARNLARRRHRDEAIRRRHEEVSASGAEADPVDEVERLRLQRLVADHVLALREPYRTAVVLRYQTGLSYARIAKRENIRQEAARQRVSRGLALLRAQLDADHGGDRGAWCLALAPLLPRGGIVPIGTGLTIGGITMGAKTAVAAAVLVLTAVGFYVWSGSGVEHAPSPVSKGVETTRAELASEQAPAEAPVTVTERVVVAAEPEPEPVGALTTADPERDLHGRVVDPEGSPVPGARIVVRRDDIREYSQLDVGRDKSGAVLAELESDALGEFAIPLEPGRPYFLFVEKEGYARAIRQDRYAGEFLEIRLDHAAAFAGRVVRASDGAGLPARIEGRRRKVGYFDVFDARTDERGTFRFEGLEAGEITVEVHPDGAAEPPWTQILLVAGETVEHEFVCEPGFAVRGRVTDARTGAPVVGAEVSEGWTFDRYVTTDAEGVYAFEHFSTSGVYDVAVRAAGYGRNRRELPEGVDGVVTLDFELEPGKRVIGSIVDPDGVPVLGAYVAAVASRIENRDQQTDWLADRTAADGGFEISDVRPDLRHGLYVVCAGFATVAYDFPDNEADLTTIDLGTIALQRPFVLRGLVVGSDGEPLPDCTLELQGMNADRGLLGGTEVKGIEIYCGERDGRSDHLGRFAFADLAPGEYELGARPPDARWHYETVRIGGSERVQEIRIELAGGLAVSGQVFDPAGEPLAGVLVMVEPKEGTASSGGHAITDVAGSFRVAGLAEGLFQLEAFPTDLAKEGQPPMLSTIMDVSPGPLPFEVHLRAATAITGRVDDALGRAVMHATVRALDQDGTIAALATTEADGSFTLSLDGGQVVDLVATPPPDDGPFYDFNQVDPALGVRLEGVRAGRSDLTLTLPPRDQAPGAER